MKITLVIVTIFLIVGITSLVMSIVEHASLAIILFQSGFLILVSTLGYMVWKKQQSG